MLITAFFSGRCDVERAHGALKKVFKLLSPEKPVAYVSRGRRALASLAVQLCSGTVDVMATLRRLGLRRMSSRPEKEPRSLLDLLDVLKIWELSKQGIAAWAVAGTIGYVLYIRPKMYPKIEYEQARTFTPKEVEDWNKAMDANKSR